MVKADFNGDGKPDLTVSSFWDSNVTVPLNNFPGVIAAPVTVSAANGTSPVAPGSIVSIYGSNLAINPMSAQSLPLPINLGGISVAITDSRGAQAALPLFYAGPTQINAEIPRTVSAGAATITITSSASSSQTGSVKLATITPSLFSVNETGAGVAAAQFVINQDGTQNIFDVFQCSFAAGAGTCVAVPLDVSEATPPWCSTGPAFRTAPHSQMSR
jgi:hypothetical protein